MTDINVCDFGERDGIRTYRVNGAKSDLERIIKECREEGARFDGEPVLEQAYRNQWSLLLKIKVAVVVGGEVGGKS